MTKEIIYNHNKSSRKIKTMALNNNNQSKFEGIYFATLIKLHSQRLDSNSIKHKFRLIYLW